MGRPDESPLGNDLMTGAKLFQCVTGGGEKLENGTPHGYFQFALPGHTPDLGRLSLVRDRKSWLSLGLRLYFRVRA